MAYAGVFKKAIFTIGGVTVSVSAVGGKRIFLPIDRRPIIKFYSKIRPSFRFNVHECRSKDLPPFSIRKPIFTNGCTWSLYERRDKKLLWLDMPSAQKPGNMMAILDMGLRRGDIYCANMNNGRGSQLIQDPLGYPFDQIFMIQLLSRNVGFIIHACGIDYRGEGLLFVGSSGAGKSTIAKLWGEDHNTKILSDDRIIVRSSGSIVKMYGTPWHGTAKYAKPDNAPLNKIFFLKHGKENKFKKLSAVEAGARLMAAAFPPLWDKKGMDFTLGLYAKILRVTPAYELAFLRNADIRSLVRTVR